MQVPFSPPQPGELLRGDSPAFAPFAEQYERCRQAMATLNGSYHSTPAIAELLSPLLAEPLDETVQVVCPFFINIGSFTRLGKRIFINTDCTLLASGGITIEDDVLIGPKVSLITEGHPEDPALRGQGLTARPIRICRGAWIGAGAIILPGVTIGEDAIVGAGAIVSKDIPPRMIAVGAPARILREIDPSK